MKHLTRRPCREFCVADIDSLRIIQIPPGQSDLVLGHSCPSKVTKNDRNFSAAPFRGRSSAASRSPTTYEAGLRAWLRAGCLFRVPDGLKTVEVEAGAEDLFTD
jgi:hypothetical protein